MRLERLSEEMKSSMESAWLSELVLEPVCVYVRVWLLLSLWPCYSPLPAFTVTLLSKLVPSHTHIEENSGIINPPYSIFPCVHLFYEYKDGKWYAMGPNV